MNTIEQARQILIDLLEEFTNENFSAAESTLIRANAYLKWGYVNNPGHSTKDYDEQQLQTY